MTQTVIRPSFETIVAIHAELISKIGGLDGIRDENLLDMSVNSSFQTFGGIDLYPTLVDKAAHLAFSLIKNHPFLDGNKRIGVTAMIGRRGMYPASIINFLSNEDTPLLAAGFFIIFLKSNGLEIDCTNKELAEFGLGLADGSYDESYAKKWIQCHVQS